MKTISIITILLVLFSCNAQEKKRSNKREDKLKFQKTTQMKTELFNVKEYSKRKNEGKTTFTLGNGTIIRQFDVGEKEELIYVEYETPLKPKYFFVYKEYYFNGVLKEKGLRFKQGKFQKGIWKKYDETGKLTKEIDYDKPFKFTFEQLVELLEKEKDTIDLYDKNTSITRGVIEEGAIWQIKWKKTFDRRETLKVDGITGKILERSFHPHEDN